MVATILLAVPGRYALRIMGAKMALRPFRARMRRGFIIFPWLYDVWVVSRAHKNVFGKRPNLLFPKTFNEKIAYRKILDRRPIYHVVSDKLAMKEYVMGLRLEVRVPRTMQIYESPEEFLAQHVSSNSVLKSSAGWNDVWFLDVNHIDESKIRSRIKEMLRAQHGKSEREWGYFGVKQRVFLEERLSDSEGRIPVDYKIFCFNGRAEWISVMSGRFTDQFRKFDMNREGQPIPMDYVFPGSEWVLPISQQALSSMIGIAEKIAADWDFLRVDMYCCGESFYVGELTPYPAAGLGRFDPEQWDRHFGDLWSEHRSLRTWLRSMVARTWAP